MRAPALDVWFPDYVLVVEGAARSAAAAHGGPDDLGHPASDDRVWVLAARGSGDDTIAEAAAEIQGRRLVITADRELRERCTAAGASVAGPSWLLQQL
jgi:hypothetical protein